MTDAFLWVSDVDRLHEEVSARGAIVQLPPTDQTWGSARWASAILMGTCWSLRQNRRILRLDSADFLADFLVCRPYRGGRKNWRGAGMRLLY